MFENFENLNCLNLKFYLQIYKTYHGLNLSKPNTASSLFPSFFLSSLQNFLVG